MKKKLILGVTLGGSSRLLDGQAKYFKDLGYEVFLVSQNHYKEQLFCKKEGITHLPVDIDNPVSPVKDIKAFLKIIKYFKRIKPDIVNVGTPKMALLGIIAARVAGIKNRIYTCRGLSFENESGLKYFFLRVAENATVRFASKVIYVSPSLKNAAILHKVYSVKKSTILGNGSSNGVNIYYFNRSGINDAERVSISEKLGLKGKIVIGFVGRVSKYKGVYELVDVFEEVHKFFPDVILIMMGHNKCEESFEKLIRADKNIIYIPFQDNVPLYMSLFDIFVLPSWREGFPNVSIQAAAMGIPVIISDSTGCVDSVNPGVNGIVFEKRNKEKLKEAIIYYLKNPDIRYKHGQAGIEWAKKFRNELIWKNISDFYDKLYL